LINYDLFIYFILAYLVTLLNTVFQGIDLFYCYK